MFTWNRTVPQDWLHELSLLAPKAERVAHLTMFWETGTPLFPIQRWVIYEAIPAAFVPTLMLDAFLADPPCTCPVIRIFPAEVVECLRCGRAQSPGRERIYDYWLKTSHLAQPFWVIQGHNGGHPYNYTQVEQQFARLHRLPDEPPEPGSLPYAPFDRRVLTKLIVRDRARGMYADLQRAHAQGRKVDAEDFRRTMVGYIDESVDVALDGIPRQHRWNDVPVEGASTTQEIDYEEATDTYITTGRMI